MKRSGFFLMVFLLILSPSSFGTDNKVIHLFSVIPVPESDDLLTVKDEDFNSNYLRTFNLVYHQLQDLQECDILIKSKKLHTTMAARPAFFSVFRRKGKRRYVILFNDDPRFTGVKLEEVPDDARKGLFAHELMHIRDYRKMTFFGLLKRGFQHFSKRGEIKFEHQIDSMTIAAGFGKELYYWSYFVLNNSSATDDYKAFKRKTYLTPENIIEIMTEIGVEDIPDDAGLK